MCVGFCGRPESVADVDDGFPFCMPVQRECQFLETRDMGSKREAVERLVEQHAQIKDEPMDAAIWIRQDEPGVWLVELLPKLSDDSDAYEPVEFGPGRTFRYSLYLIAGNRLSLEKAVAAHTDLAEWIARGDAVYGESGSEYLMSLARGVLDAHQPQTA